MRNVRFYIRFLIFSAVLVFIGYESAVISFNNSNKCKKVTASHGTESEVDTEPIRKELLQTKDAKIQRKASLKISQDFPTDTTVLRQQIQKKLHKSVRQEMRGVTLGNRSIDDLLLREGGRPIRTLIVGTWRSGSSFLGDILRSHPGTYYMYEPLVQLCTCQIRNGTLAERAVEKLRKLFECKYDDPGDDYIDSTVKRHENHKCNKRLWKICRTKRGVCRDAQFISSACEAFPVQTVKTVRLRLEVAQKLLEDDSMNLKILYLVRDPRATINSRFEHQWCLKSQDCYDPSRLCTDLAREYHVSSHLQHQYPTRFMPVKYETLTADVFNMTKRILKFLGLNYHFEIKKYLLSHTKYNAGSAFSTVRDTQATASHWLLEWANGFRVINSIQNSCVAAMNLWGYQNVTESDLMQLQSLE